MLTIMKVLRLIIGILGTIILSSCAGSKFLTSDVKPTEMDDLLKFETFSYISLIEKRDKAILDDSVSRLSKALFDEAITAYKDKMPAFSDEIKLSGQEEERLEKAVQFLYQTKGKRKSFENNVITVMIDSLLSAHNKRFGLIFVVSGYTRTQDNYRREIKKEIFLSNLSKTHPTIPTKSKSVVYAIIVDGEKKNIAFYGKSVKKEKEPAEKKVLMEQIQSIFENSFWKRQ